MTKIHPSPSNTQQKRFAPDNSTPPNEARLKEDWEEYQHRPRFACQQRPKEQTNHGLATARDRSYAALDQLCFEGMHFHRDIAAKGLK